MQPRTGTSSNSGNMPAFRAAASSHAGLQSPGREHHSYRQVPLAALADPGPRGLTRRRKSRHGKGQDTDADSSAKLDRPDDGQAGSGNEFDSYPPSFPPPPPTFRGRACEGRRLVVAGGG